MELFRLIDAELLLYERSDIYALRAIKEYGLRADAALKDIDEAIVGAHLLHSATYLLEDWLYEFLLLLLEVLHRGLAIGYNPLLKLSELSLLGLRLLGSHCVSLLLIVLHLLLEILLEGYKLVFHLRLLLIEDLFNVLGLGESCEESLGVEVTELELLRMG